MKNKMKALYDELYEKGYHGDISICHTKNLIHNGVENLIPKGKKILDVGCSIGAAMLIMKELGYDVFGIDISDVAVNNCTQKGLNSKCCESHEINFDFKFDGITCTDVLEHVKESNINKTFFEFHRLLNDDGYIFLKIALKAEGNRSFDNIVNKHGFKNLHILVKDKSYWINLIEEHKFNIVNILSSDYRFIELIIKK